MAGRSSCERGRGLPVRAHGRYASRSHLGDPAVRRICDSSPFAVIGRCVDDQDRLWPLDPRSSTAVRRGGGWRQGFLLSVSATSASNAWAVGFTTAAGFPQTMMLRWSGTGWRRVASPNPGGTIGTVLSGVSAVSASDAWAVGAFDTPSGRESLARHWNGSTWERVPAPGNA
jgi:hypothetical protein